LSPWVSRLRGMFLRLDTFWATVSRMR